MSSEGDEEGKLAFPAYSVLKFEAELAWGVVEGEGKGTCFWDWLSAFFFL